MYKKSQEKQSRPDHCQTEPDTIEKVSFTKKCDKSVTLVLQMCYRGSNLLFRKRKRKRKKLRRPLSLRRQEKDAKLSILGLTRSPRRKRRRLLSDVKRTPTQKYKIQKRKKSLRPIDAAKRRMKRALDIARLDGVLNWLGGKNDARQIKNTKFWRSRQKKAQIL